MKTFYVFLFLSFLFFFFSTLLIFLLLSSFSCSYSSLFFLPLLLKFVLLNVSCKLVSLNFLDFLFFILCCCCYCFCCSLSPPPTSLLSFFSGFSLYVFVEQILPNKTHKSSLSYDMQMKLVLLTQIFMSCCLSFLCAYLSVFIILSCLIYSIIKLTSLSSTASHFHHIPT